MLSCQGERVRADRLLSMLWLLMSHEKLSAPNLARRLEVTPRTVLRDVEALSAAGVPVYCERGRTGGVRLLPGFRTNVSGLSDDETRALFAAVATSGADALGWGPALASGLRKVVAGLPAERRPTAVDVAARLVIEPEGWLPDAAVPHLAQLKAAALGDRRVRLRYRSREAQEATWREVDPYGLVSSGGVWYLVAGVGDEPRVFRVSRVRGVQVLDEPARRPPGLDVRTVWTERRRQYRDAGEPVVVEVRADPATRREVEERAAAAVEVPGTGEAGETRLRLTFGDARHARSVLLLLGTGVEVLEPGWLRAEIRETAERILARYR